MGLPYVFRKRLYVEVGGDLVLDPGIEVRVDTGFYVHGNLTALGTAAEPIRLQWASSSSRGWWVCVSTAARSAPPMLRSTM